MKVLAFNGSARAKGNTAILLNMVLDELKNEGIETELVSLAGRTFPGCRASRAQPRLPGLPRLPGPVGAAAPVGPAPPAAAAPE